MSYVMWCEVRSSEAVCRRADKLCVAPAGSKIRFCMEANLGPNFQTIGAVPQRNEIESELPVTLSIQLTFTVTSASTALEEYIVLGPEVRRPKLKDLRGLFLPV